MTTKTLERLNSYESMLVELKKWLAENFSIRSRVQVRNAKAGDAFACVSGAILALRSLKRAVENETKFKLENPEIRRPTSESVAAASTATFGNLSLTQYAWVDSGDFAVPDVVHESYFCNLQFSGAMAGDILYGLAVRVHDVTDNVDYPDSNGTYFFLGGANRQVGSAVIVIPRNVQNHTLRVQLFASNSGITLSGRSYSFYGHSPHRHA